MSTSHAAGITNFHTIPYEITQLLILIVQNGAIIQNYLQHLQFNALASALCTSCNLLQARDINLICSPNLPLSAPPLPPLTLTHC